MSGDPTYVRAEIEENPIWRRAFQLSEQHNDNAPIGWGRYIPQAWGEMKDEAENIVTSWASKYAPDVPADVVASICKALGEISIDEAKEAINRLQIERVRG